MTNSTQMEAQMEKAAKIIDKQPQPVCPKCSQPMQYAEGADHVPPHWWCASDKEFASDSPTIAADSEMALMRRIATALAEAATPSVKWQPIESAPQSGAEILTTSQRGLGAYYVDLSRWLKLDKYPTWIGRNRLPTHPTHWQPLPPPPSERE